MDTVTDHLRILEPSSAPAPTQIRADGVSSLHDAVQKATATGLLGA